MKTTLIQAVPTRGLARWVWLLKLHLPGAPVLPAEPLSQTEWMVLWRLRRRDATPLSVALETGMTLATVRVLIASVQQKYLCNDLRTLQAVIAARGMPPRPGRMAAVSAALP